MVTIAVCDDCSAERHIIMEHLHTFSKKQHLDLSILEFESGKTLLASFKKKPFDIIFLDIYMNPLSGLDTAHRIREVDEHSAIVFTTSSLDHAIESYDVNALFYLVKPISFEKLAFVMEKYEKLYGESKQYLEFTTNRIVTRVFLKDILYLEVFGHKTKIYCVNGFYSTNKPLIEIEKELSKSVFLRCHRCFIVNMQHINQVAENFFMLSDGTEILIAVKEKFKIKQQFADYCFKNLNRRLDY